MPKKEYKSIAIIGPDGSGKTSVVNLMSLQTKAIVIYCGKRNFYYKIIDNFNKLILALPYFLFPIKIYLRYIFYIFETFDILKRINSINSNKIIERYYVDRLIRFDELILLYKAKEIRPITYFIEIPLAYLMNIFYLKKIKKNKINIVLLNVESSLLFSRSSGEYKNVLVAEIKNTCYLKYKRFYKQIINVQSNTSIENIVNQIKFN